MLKKMKKLKAVNGFSLIEMVVVITSAAILIFAVGAFMENGQRSWNHLFGRVYGSTTVDGFVVHRAFDTICRKASVRKYVIGDDGDTLELYYWDKESSAAIPENYAKFYLSDEVLYVQHGKLQTGTWVPNTASASAPINIAGQVESVKFEAQGTAVTLYLTYTDKEAMPVFCSSVRHND